MRFQTTWLALVAAAWTVGAFAQTDGVETFDLSRDPAARGLADVLFSRGFAELGRGDYGSALPLFEQASNTRRADATYRYYAAYCKLRLGRLDEAVFELQSTLPPAENRVSEARVRYDLADAFYLKGYLSAARRELKRATVLDDGDGWTHFYLGLVMLAQGETAEALDEFDLAVGRAPELKSDGAYYLGIAAYERGQLEAARSYFEQALTGSSGTTANQTSSREWLDFLVDEQRPGGLPRSDIEVSLGIERDDNPDEVNRDLVLGTPSDYGTRVRVRAVYRPWIARDGWTIGGLANGYGIWHEHAGPGDLVSIQGLVHAAWGADPLGYAPGPLGYARVPVGTQRFGVLLQAGTSYFKQDGNAFRRDHEIAASLLLYEPGLGKTQFEVGFDDVRLLDVRSRGHSGSRTLFRVGQYFYLRGRPEQYLKLALGLTQHAPDVGGLRRDATQLLAELALPLTPRWNFFLLGSYGRDEYTEASRAFYSIASSREDKVSEIVVKATLALARSGFITFRYGWLDRSVDTLNSVSFDRTVATVGYTHYW